MAHNFFAKYSLIFLIFLSFIWEAFFNPLRDGSSWLILKSVILLFPLRGILKNNIYTLKWSGMLIILFFIEGVVRFYSERGISQWFALAEIILTVIFLVSIGNFFWKKKYK
ncbi:MAG: DUF2069 domain-containing protein [Methylophilaceae bacterium]|nr:DUF2069 domain-containing protein [Methylophilaceae bacterium]MBL6726221.1 DUF2069 domain-containing protein [Methylophilaceae bacterium]MBL6728266.1 DUF2069 domain-containing protein [Methylophilaceae bacterium]MBL6790866.1 DUF2069 domain-containing protein [Methylophilaceae bacterium]